MLKIFSNLSDLNFSNLMEVYHQSNKENALQQYPFLDLQEAVLSIQQDIYQDLREFYRIANAYYAVWCVDGQYVSAVRVEPYRDGVLITCLETAVSFRRMGYANCLLQSLMTYLKRNNIHKVYSHVAKSNVASLSLHKSIGFVLYSDMATFIDGTVTGSSVTFIKCL